MRHRGAFILESWFSGKEQCLEISGKQDRQGLRAVWRTVLPHIPQELLPPCLEMSWRLWGSIVPFCRAWVGVIRRPAPPPPLLHPSCVSASCSTKGSILMSFPEIEALWVDPTITVKGGFLSGMPVTSWSLCGDWI